ncbi:MAG TPA: ATPase, T2SS/T4P/T4SS family [Woeseiaceae bacterium]|nr:ATPase, T2SS/T4P/T4SS family [Woeseiaceae bacterium]
MSAIPQEIFNSALEYFLDPIKELLADESVREIMINGVGQIYIEKKGSLEKSSITFPDEDQLLAAVRNIAQYVGHYIRPGTARFDARLPQGHRVHVVLPPVCRQGISVTIRKHTKSAFGLEDLVRLGSINEESKDFLRLCMEREKNMVISGGTGTGKTTFINALSALIPKGERIITIEDAAELQLDQEHVVSLEARPPDRKGEGAVTIRDLLHSSLRMRPDRIIVGECRGGEALDLLQAMNTGHGGSMSTLHANSPIESLRRLETLALFSGEEIPLRFLRAQVASAIDIVVQLQRLRTRRTVQSIAQVLPLTDSGEYAVREIYTYDYVNEGLKRVGEASFEAEPHGSH